MDAGRNKNYGRGAAASGARGRGSGRGNYQNQGAGGRGWDAQQRGSNRHMMAEQQGVNRSPTQAHSGGNQPPAQQAWGHRPHQVPQAHSGGNQPPAQQAWGHRPLQVPQAHSGGNQPPVQQAWGHRPLQVPPSQQTPHQGLGPAGGRVDAWTGRPWGQSRTPSSSTVQSQPLPPPSSSAEELDIRSLRISAQQSPSFPSESKESEIKPIRRPDQGGSLSVRSIKLLVNHYPVKFDPEKTIFHYDVDAKPVAYNDNRLAKKSVGKSELLLIRDKLFSDDRFPILKTAYDGGKNIFSAVSLPTGQFKVDISDGEDVKRRSYMLTIEFVKELKLSKLKEYLRGELSYIPREILQAMDVVMKENPSRQRICAGKCFYSPEYWREHDLMNGVAAYRGFQQSLKPTSQGLVLCLDYSILAFLKPMPVIEFLLEHVHGVESVNDIKSFRRQVNSALKGLKVQVTHRLSRQKYTIAGLAEEDTCDSYFSLDDPEGNNPSQIIRLVTYFQDKWGKDIKYQNIPCLELGKNNRSNKVPMEFCVLAVGQRYPKELLGKDEARFLKDLTLVKPWVRKDADNEMLRSKDGPCGDVSRKFGIGVDMNMTKVAGRVIGAPDLKLGGNDSVKVDREKCQWNLVGRRSLVDGKSVEHWALLDFTEGERSNRLQAKAFVNNLRGRCRNLGICMEEPLLYRATRMNEFSSVNRIENLLKNVVGEANRISKGKLQLIVCVMAQKDPGYKFLKWVSETRIGVVTQCCLSFHANKAQDQYLANLCLKINAKLGGSNFELMGKLPHFDSEDHVMFIGADVNHPGPMNKSCPSIAAVVGTVNWPAANRYAARVSPQVHRQEKISNFGIMCLDLINTYARLNKVKPNKLVVFRDGVSEGQFEMVLAEELLDLKNAIHDSNYQPKITIIVAQKRHQTRLFPENRNDGGASGNVPPGTVVDTKIVHPFDFDFYLCSHYGSLGTSKPTHYYVLFDENSFASDELQKLIYDMCFTFARCTKPVSLVPPVYYADLVAYRGRLFQEAAMESPALASSSHGATSTSSSPVLFEQSFCNLHSDLENIMFFV